MPGPRTSAVAPPGGWQVAQEKPSATDGDFNAAILDNQILNENLNSEQEALERAYDKLIERGSKLGMQGLTNPYNEFATGELRQITGSALGLLPRETDPSYGNTPFAYESGGIRRLAVDFERKWNTEVERLSKQAETRGQSLDATLNEASIQAVTELSKSLRREAAQRLEGIKEVRGQGFFSVDTLTEFGLSMVGSLNDPAQVATLGVGWGGKKILTAAFKEAAVNSGVEAALQPGIQASKLDAEVIETWDQAVGDGLMNVTLAGALGGLFGGGGKAIDNIFFKPGRERTEAFRGLYRDVEGASWDDVKIQQAVLKMIGDVVEAEGPIQPSMAMAEALREAASKAADPAAAARLSTAADQVEEAARPPEDPDVRMDRARTAMKAVADVTAETDPETAAIVRMAAAEAEKEYATARQKRDGMDNDQFVEAIEQADAKVHALRQFTERPERPLPEPKRDWIDLSDDAPAPEMGARLSEDGKAVTFTRFDPRELAVAPDEFQYKRYRGEQGVNDAISDVETWHAPSSGKVLVFERANGEKVIVDGHQRRALSRGIMDRQGRDDIRLDGYLYREADGWTAADMRLKGAQKNIREGRSDVLDTAQALRERADAIDSSFPVSRSNIRQARQLARLSPEAWDLTRAGVLEPQYGALIAQVAPDRPDMHAPLARTLIEAAPANVRQAESIVSDALLDYAERNTDTQASLFGDDNLGRAVMYKERAQIMDAAYAWLRSERSVFKALVDNGDIARALGNELVDAANLTAKDQVELAIAAVMHSRRAGVRTAVTDMVVRALDSVRREGVTPTRAGQQVAREIRALVEERGFRALIDAEGPPRASPQMAEAGPLFDGPGTKAHIEHADMLEGNLRPEGIEDPGVDLAKLASAPDAKTRLFNEFYDALQGVGDRTPEQIFSEFRAVLEPKKEGEGKPVDPVKQAQAELRQYMDAEDKLRDALAGLTDMQKVALVRMQYPDAYPQLNRLKGPDLDDAIVERVMAGDVKFARGGGGEIRYERFNSDLLNASENKVVEMARNGLPNMDIAVEMGLGVNSVKVILSRAQKKLREGGVEVTIEPGQKGPAIEGFSPGDFSRAVAEIMESGADSTEVLERLAARGMNSTPASVYSAVSRWRAAKRKGVKFARGEDAPGRVLDDEFWIPDATQESLDALYRRAIEQNKIPPVLRLFRDTEGRIFAWDSAKASHNEARAILGLGDVRLQHGQFRYGSKLKMTDWYDVSGTDKIGVRFARGLDPMGFYSAAQVAAETIPANVWQQGWPAVRSALAKGRDGVTPKKAEIEYLALDTMFAGTKLKGAELRDAVLADIAASRLELVERYSRFDPKGKENTQAGFEELIDELNDKISEIAAVLTSDRGDLRRLPELEAERDALRERVLAVKDGLAAAGIRTGPGKTRLPGEEPVFEWRALLPRGEAGSSFKSHWSRYPTSDDGVLVSVRGEERLDDRGGRTLFGGEVQSDLGSFLRNFREKKDGKYIWTKEAEFADQILDNLDGVPLAGDTSTWTNVAVRAMVYRAARDGFDSVSFPTAETSDIIQGNAQAAKHYETNVKPALDKIARQLGGEVRQGGVKYNSALSRESQELLDDELLDELAAEGSTDAASAYVLDITPQMRERIVRDGFPLFARPDEGVDPAGMTPAEAIDRLKAEFGEDAGGLLRVSELNITDVPPRWAHPKTQGLTDASGRVTLFSANVSPDELRGLVLHEIGIHAGLRSVLGDKGFDAVLAQLDERLAADDVSVRTARGRVPADTDPAHIREETLAYLIQHAPKHNIVQRLIADVRAWLFKTFPMLRDRMTLTDADLQSLALGAVRQRIREANWSTPFSRTKTGAVFVAPPPRYARGPSTRKPVAPTDEELIEAADKLTPLLFEIWKGAREGLNATDIADRINANRPDATMRAGTVRKHLTTIRKKGFEIVPGTSGTMAETTMRVLELKAQGLTGPQIAARVFPDQPLAAATSNVNVLIHNHRDQLDELISTRPVKYARRRADGPDSSQTSGGAQIPGGAGRAGQPDVRGNAGARPGTAQRGDVQPGAQPRRAVATEPLPEAPPDAGLLDWNEQLNLSADQRAERRAQFSDFVDSAEVTTTSQRFMADWDYRNGRMAVGGRRMVESRAYHVKTTPDMHESWVEALGIEETAVRVEIHKGEAIIPESHVADAFRSTGLGTKLYMRAIDDMLDQGLVVNSDVNVSANAIAMWKSLRKRGYDVTQRVPDSRLERGEDGMYSHDGEPVSVFFIARRKPAPPELPETDRDIANRIDEARALNEHIPKCIKGK